MKYDRAWPQTTAEDAKVFPKAYEEPTTVDQILQETFETDEDDSEAILKQAPRRSRKSKKNNVKKQLLEPSKQSEDFFHDIKNVWIAFLVIFLLGLYAFNTIFFRLGILETLMSRQTNGST